jgi:hypothetical protein
MVNEKQGSTGSARDSAIQETFRELRSLLDPRWPGSEVLTVPLAELGEALDQTYGLSGESPAITTEAIAELVQRIQRVEDGVWALELRQRGGRR